MDVKLIIKTKICSVNDFYDRRYLQVATASNRSHNNLIPCSYIQNFPHNCIGVVECIQRKGDQIQTQFATGFLIDHNTVVTVAHIFIKQFTEGYKCQIIAFYPGHQNGALVGGIKVKPNSLIIPEKYIQYSKRNKQSYFKKDYLIFKLVASVGLNEYLKFAVGNIQQDMPIQIYGYPGGKYILTTPQTVHPATYHFVVRQEGYKGLSGPRTNQLMDHYILTYRGQSGSPVLIKFNNSYYVIGIHFGGNLKYMVNNFMIFNEEIVKDIAKDRSNYISLSQNQINQIKMSISDNLIKIYKYGFWDLQTNMSNNFFLQQNYIELNQYIRSQELAKIVGMHKLKPQFVNQLKIRIQNKNGNESLSNLFSVGFLNTKYKGSEYLAYQQGITLSHSEKVEGNTNKKEAFLFYHDQKQKIKQPLSQSLFTEKGQLTISVNLTEKWFKINDKKSIWECDQNNQYYFFFAINKKSKRLYIEYCNFF